MDLRAWLGRARLVVLCSMCGVFCAVVVAAQPCLPDGDVNGDTQVTPADALLTFRHFLGLSSLDDCQRTHANVLRHGSGGITPADALCIFQYFLGAHSCLDTPVGITITAPTDRALTREAMLALSGQVDRDVATVTVNGSVASLVGRQFTATVPLRDGPNMVVVVATMGNGNTETQSLEVTRDVFPPTVRIDAPADGFVSATQTIAVTGQVNDIVSGGTEAQVTVNGAPAQVMNGSFMRMNLPL